METLLSYILRESFAGILKASRENVARHKTTHSPEDGINQAELRIACEHIIELMVRLIGDVKHAVPVLVSADELLFMFSSAQPVVCIKMYTDTSWVDLGWKGPCITVRRLGDYMHHSVQGVIPDDLEKWPVKDVIAVFTAFRTNELASMSKSDSCVIKYEETYNKLVSMLNELNISFH